jgi:3-hydroxy-D-aspartate aldolase
MTTRPPAEIGMSLDEVDTPALVIDLDAFERNLKRLPERVGGKARLRPHAKTHKCAVVALKQIELGAVGVCCQKVSEAEAMVYGGVRDVLVTNEIVGRQKLRRLMGLAGTARIATCADDTAQIAALDEAAGEVGLTLPVHVEVNMGGNRCGVEPGEPALDLARKIVDARHLSFAGLQAYHGSAQHLRTWDERQKAIASAVEKAGTTRDLLARNGIDCTNITGAGTGTFEFEAASGVYSELQWLLHLHGRRIRPQPRARRRPDLGLRAEPLRVGDEYRALRTMIRSRSRVWFVQLAPGHRLDVDIGFVLASLREVVGHLQAQPGFRAAAECLVKAVRHIR